MNFIKENYKKIILYLLIFVAGIIVSVVSYKLFLKYNELNDISRFFTKILNYNVYSSKNVSVSFGKILLAILLIVLGVLSARSLTHRILAKILNKTNLDNGAKSSVENIVYYILIVIFSLLALNIAEVPLTILTIFGGALAIGVGFGSQNLVSNFISGLIIQFERPVNVGDIVEIEGITGRVIEIGARSTKIRTSQNYIMVMPNSLFLDKKFLNFTFENHLIRGQVNLGLSTQISSELVIKEIRSIIGDITQISKSREPLVFVSDFTDANCIYTILFWIQIDSVSDKILAEGLIRSKLQEHFLKSGIILNLAKDKKEALGGL